LEVFDSASGTWSTLGALQPPLAGTSPAVTAAALLPSGRLLVIEAPSAAARTVSEAFDVGAGAAAPAGALRGTHLGGIAAGLRDGRTLVVGGSGSPEVYVGTW